MKFFWQAMRASEARPDTALSALAGGAAGFAFQVTRPLAAGFGHLRYYMEGILFVSAFLAAALIAGGMLPWNPRREWESKLWLAWAVASLFFGPLVGHAVFRPDDR